MSFIAKNKKILVVATSNDKLGSTGKQTGWYLPEIAHPFEVFTKAKCELTFASPKGGKAPVDMGSVDAFKEDESCVSFLKNHSKLVNNTVKLSTVDPTKFDAVFFAGGYGTMWDFPDDPDVQRIAAKIAEQGGVVSAVCHGPVALLNVKLSDGSFLVAGREVAAFTNDEEDAMSLRTVVPYTLEDKLKALGAKYKKGDNWAATVAVDGNLITGQNPASAGPTAEAVVEALNSPPKVLIVLTSHNELGTTGKQTGWYLPELAHPFAEFTAAKFDITLASIKGGEAPVDEGSVEAFKADETCVNFLKDQAKLVAGSAKLSEVDPFTFDAVLFAGGYGTMWDFPDDLDVQRVAAAVAQKGGIVSAVCHGPIALINVKLSDGSYLVEGKEVSAFTNEEEDAMSLREVVPYTCEDKLKAVGVKFKKGDNWAPTVSVDGKLITGQNPASAGPLAKAVIKAVNSL